MLVVQPYAIVISRYVVVMLKRATGGLNCFKGT